MISKRLFAIITASAFIGGISNCLAQSQTPASDAMTGMPGMAGMTGMASSVDLNDPMSQEASGTGWLPASTPMYGQMLMRPNGDMLMAHGAIMPRYTDVGSKRGDRKADAPNWFMGMYSHPLDSQSQLGAHLMMSLDPVTEGGFGYPLLFQTGETWGHKPLHDRQHPHDFFDEVSATYSRLVGGGNSVYFYAADPGEPALGPPTYMHRLLALDYPDAPIGHHWQDATHITFGVVTAGMNFGSKVKIEGSDFTGREPDENRWNFDKPRWDSYSGRVSFNPNPDNSFQISYGFVKDPEGDGANVDRTTASWVYDKPLGEDSNFTSALVWGQNDLSSEGKSESYLLEGDYQRGANTWFTRWENIQKSGHELVLPAPFDNSTLYDVNAITMGYVRDLTHGKGIDTGLGLAVTVDTKPTGLTPFYGGGTPVGFEVYLRLRASRMRMGMKMSSDEMPGMSISSPNTAPSVSQPANPTPSAPASVPPPVTPAPATSAVRAPLTATPPPASATPAPTQPAPSEPKQTTVARVTTTISPNPPKARHGNILAVELADSDGKPVAGAKITAAVSMTTMDMGTSRPTFKDLGDGRYQATVSFAMPGPWQVALTIKEGNGKPITKVMPYNVGR